MRGELIILGGAASRAENGGEKKPSIGGSAGLLIHGECGLLVDCGSYYQFGKAEVEETRRVILEYEEIGDYRLPIMPKSYLANDSDFPPTRPGSSLPDFTPLYGLKLLVIVLGHGHGDHIGALPRLRKNLALRGIETIIIATQPTLDLCVWSWMDQLNVMHNKGQEAGYDRRMVLKLKEEVKIMAPGERKRFGPFDLSFIHAGHILGAISVLAKVGLEPKTFFFTSDISFRDQYTVKSAPRYSSDDFGGVDYLISEFTYGDREPPPRKDEVRRLIKDCLITLERGGKVLITALSIGRSAEIFSALKQYGLTGQYPVWVNGSARNTGFIYRKHGVVSEDEDINEHFVVNSEHSEKIKNGCKPCIMIAPAGMLTGGYALGFASAWANDEKNLIALTCFQRKNSPGYKLLHFERGKRIRLGDTHIVLRAYVKAYSLSAHASGTELRAMFQRLAPRKILLVHGEEAAMDSFALASGGKAEKAIVGKIYTV